MTRTRAGVTQRRAGSRTATEAPSVALFFLSVAVASPALSPASVRSRDGRVPRRRKVSGEPACGPRALSGRRFNPVNDSGSGGRGDFATFRGGEAREVPPRAAEVSELTMTSVNARPGLLVNSMDWQNPVVCRGAPAHAWAASAPPGRMPAAGGADSVRHASGPLQARNEPDPNSGSTERSGARLLPGGRRNPGDGPHRQFPMPPPSLTIVGLPDRP